MVAGFLLASPGRSARDANGIVQPVSFHAGEAFELHPLHGAAVGMAPAVSHFRNVRFPPVTRTQSGRQWTLPKQLR